MWWESPSLHPSVLQSLDDGTKLSQSVQESRIAFVSLFSSLETVPGSKLGLPDHKSSHP